MSAFIAGVGSTKLPEKRLEPKKDLHFYSSLIGAFEGFSFSGISAASGTISTWAPVVVCAKAPKVAEVERQICRVRPYLDWLSMGGADMVDGEGLNTSMGLLHLMAAGPAPVPIMSVGNDGKSALYVRDGDLSLEITVDGKSVEYFMASRSTNEETFDEEEVEEGRIPPKLLGLIYSKFAGNTAG